MDLQLNKFNINPDLQTLKSIYNLNNKFTYLNNVIQTSNNKAYTRLVHSGLKTYLCHKARNMNRKVSVLLPEFGQQALHNIVPALLLFISSATAYAGNGDSIRYWVNRDYVACLEQYRSACNCQSEQEYLILAVDTAARTVMAEPSIFFSWEDLQFEIVQVIDKKGFYRIPLTYGIDSFATIEMGSNRLRLRSRTQSADFVPYSMLKIKNYESDKHIETMLKGIHSIPLLQCNLIALPPETPPFAPNEFFALVLNGRVQITCSDDFGYTEMRVQYNDSNTFHFFMVYQAKAILLYQIPPRNRRQAVDVDRLTPCYKFLKPE